MAYATANGSQCHTRVAGLEALDGGRTGTQTDTRYAQSPRGAVPQRIVVADDGVRIAAPAGADDRTRAVTDSNK